MAGSIIKRGNSYRLAIPTGEKDDKGRYKYHWETFSTWTKADKRRTQLAYEIENGTYTNPGKLTLSDFLDKWVKDYVKPNLASRTSEVYEMNVNNHVKPVLGKHRIGLLNKSHVSKFYSDKLAEGLSAQTVVHFHTMLHKAMETAIEWGLVTRNVIDLVKPPRVTKPEMQVWTAQEVMIFLATAKDSNYYAMFHLVLFTGLRRSELLGLKWGDIDFEGKVLSVNRSLQQKTDQSFVLRPPKTAGSVRTIEFTPNSLEVTKQYYEKCKAICAKTGVKFDGDTLVFCKLDSGEPIRPNTATRAWTLLAKTAKLKLIRLHDARHTHASILLKQGVHPKVVQERLGHTSIQITLDTYSHIVKGMQAHAAEAFDKAFKDF